MNKWKDTAITSVDVTRKVGGVQKTILAANSLVIVERELPTGLILVVDINPKKSDRRHYKLKTSEIVIENYQDTRDIHMQMLLADGWDAQDLLNVPNE